MAFVVNDRVKETTTSTGTGTINLGGAETGFETFVAGIGNSNTTYYCIQAQGGAAFEIGVGTVTDAAPDTLSRTAIISSSNSDSVVDFSAGTKDVFCTLPASKAVIEDSSTNADIAGNLTVGGTVDGVDIAARDSVLTSTTTTANSASSTANAALPKAGGTMSGNLVMSSANITMSGTETVDGVDISARDAVLSSTTTTANAALPKAGGTMTGDIAHASNFGLDIGGEITLDADGGKIRFKDAGTEIGRVVIDNSQDLEIVASVQDKNIKFRGDDGGSGITALTLDMSTAGKATFNNDIALGDSQKAVFGASEDLQILHNGANSLIDSNTGELQILSDNLRLKNAANNETLAEFTNGSSCVFKFNDNTKLATTDVGVTVTGTLTATTLAGALPYGSLTGTPTIPSNNNQLTNGAGYVTSSGVTSVATGNGCTGGTITSTGTISMSGSYSGSFSASSNITAYSSDERLKDFKGKIDNALDKVDELNGYYFEWNDVAKGLDGGRSFKEGMEVGVSAQEIEKVLPEVVTEAPIVKIENLDVDYKTVYYDKIVPLLIEAIKELRAEVKELKKDR